ncbi:hypothetical protein llap_8689 [Limosa lapponica baueri]|uniref:Uncharacterized protein n=1 Tax=Limosa lapponica baueri TaxID=1758121 RepID=A0A2I0U4Q8_LIMLA|nr:hypothetical protein llap_8689 [Limosa lapponica baueri]
MAAQQGLVALRGDPVATILLSPLAWTSARQEACALAVEGDASAEVIPGSQLITPHGAAGMLLFPGSLHHVDNTYAKIWEVIVLAFMCLPDRTGLKNSKRPDMTPTPKVAAGGTVACAQSL